jgi:hypothetical protein
MTMRTVQPPPMRLLERDEIVERHPTHCVARTVRVLQQFWPDPNGKDAVGDMFNVQMGEWRDVPIARTSTASTTQPADAEDTGPTDKAQRIK